VKAAIHSIRKQNPSTIVVATPVGPPDTIDELRREVDRLVCPVIYEPFFAIGQFYESFDQVSDEEVVRLLKLSKRE
jgi:predicted phosphoribosyltransferase